MLEPTNEKKVTSRKLLVRLESKGLIREPPEHLRPEKPSQRRWGTARGYHYVELCENTPSPFSFEGRLYRAKIDRQGRTFLFSEPIQDP